LGKNRNKPTKTKVTEREKTDPHVTPWPGITKKAPLGGANNSNRLHQAEEPTKKKPGPHANPRKGNPATEAGRHRFPKKDGCHLEKKIILKEKKKEGGGGKEKR